MDANSKKIIKRRMEMMSMLEYKGYQVEQSQINKHVTVYRDGRRVFHASCDKPKTDEELKEIVDFYIELHGR